MRSLILLSVILLLFCQTARAERDDLSCCPVPGGYIGLFADEEHSTWCLEGAGMYTFYLFALPLSSEGMRCVELRTVVNSPDVAVFAPIYNELVKEPILGGIPGNLAVCFKVCLIEDWVRIFSASAFVMAANEASITIEAFTGSPYPKFLDCGGVEVEANIYTYLWINMPWGCYMTPVKESTWGAIKDMYK